MKNLKKKTLLALAVTLLLASAGTFLLGREGVRLVEEREETRSIRKLEAADNLYQLILERVDRVYGSLENHGRKNVEIMTAALGKYLKDGEYTGPVCFEDGLVFRGGGDGQAQAERQGEQQGCKPFHGHKNDSFLFTLFAFSSA